MLFLDTEVGDSCAISRWSTHVWGQYTSQSANGWALYLICHVLTHVFARLGRTYCINSHMHVIYLTLLYHHIARYVSYETRDRFIGILYRFYTFITTITIAEFCHIGLIPSIAKTSWKTENASYLALPMRLNGTYGTCPLAGCDLSKPRLGNSPCLCVIVKHHHWLG